MPHPRLDPRNDVVFKLLFGSTEPLLVALLEAVLRPPVPIRRALVKNPEIPKSFVDDKGSYLDVLVTLDDGSLVDVEMQCSREAAFRERALYYWAGIFAGQLAKGEHHERLSRVVSVLFLDYVEFPFPQFHETFALRGDAAGALFSRLLEIHTLELPKARGGAEASPTDELLRWCRFLSTSDPLELAELSRHDRNIAMAEKRLTELSADPEARELARWRHRNETGYRITLDGARREGREEALRSLLEPLLVARFGPLDERQRARVACATGEELEAMASLAPQATSIDEVLALRR